jgi:hypothetical protein
MSALADGSALLWRLQLQNVDVSDRWRLLADRWAMHNLADARGLLRGWGLGLELCSESSRKWGRCSSPRPAPAVPGRKTTDASRTLRMKLVTAPQPVVSCQFAERLAAWLGHLVAPVIAGRMSADLRAVRARCVRDM